MLKSVRIFLSMSFAMGLTPLFAASSSVGFDVNDVSVLFPLSKSQPYPDLNLITHPHLLSFELLNEVLKFENPDKNLLDLPYPNMETLSRPDRWKITSIRLDDCGDLFHLERIAQTTVVELTRASRTCQPRIRLVLQPFNGFGQPLVSALHLNYRLPQSAFETSIQTFKNLRDETTKLGTSTAGQPLAVHPGLAIELSRQKSETLGRIISDYLKHVVKDSYLELVTMTLSTESRHWKFVGGYVESGRWKRFVTGFSRGLYPQIKSDLGIEELTCNFYDVCHSTPQNTAMSELLLTRIFRPDFAKRPENERKITETLILAESVDSVKVDFFSTNCISCHESSNYRSREKLLLSTTAEEHPRGITPYTWGKLVSETASSVINFGYDGTHARVSTRTAAESVHVADRINQSYGLKNPGYTPRDHSAFWQCLMAMDANQNCFNK